MFCLLLSYTKQWVVLPLSHMQIADVLQILFAVSLGFILNTNMVVHKPKFFLSFSISFFKISFWMYEHGQSTLNLSINYWFVEVMQEGTAWVPSAIALTCHYWRQRSRKYKSLVRFSLLIRSVWLGPTEVFCCTPEFIKKDIMGHFVFFQVIHSLTCCACFAWTSSLTSSQKCSCNTNAASFFLFPICSQVLLEASMVFPLAIWKVCDRGKKEVCSVSVQYRTFESWGSSQSSTASPH